jgi:hypothetical protein
MVNNTVEDADIFQSGIVVPDPEMARMLSGGGRLFNHPVWNDLEDTEPEVPTDNPADVMTPDKLGSFKHQFIRNYRTKGWSDADLSRELAGSDPMLRIQSRTSAWWNRYFNRMTVRTLTGIINDNIANDSSDMVLDITGLGGTVTHGGATTSASAVNAGAVLEAKQTLGDEATGLSVMIMHSRIYTNLQLQNLIAFIPNSRGEIVIPTYQGYRVLVSDAVPAVDVGGGDIHFTTYLCGEGIIGWAESPPDVPVAVEREELQGNGAGVETLVTRRQFSMHPVGFNFTDASVAGTFPTDAELESAANWDRVYPERKQIKIAALISLNG